MSRRSPALVVLGNELLCLVRDRRALFLAVVLPMLLYPVLFAATDRLDDAAERSIDEKTARVGHELSALPAPIREALLARWRAPERHLQDFEVPPSRADELAGLSADEARATWSHLSADLIVSAERLAPGDAPQRERFVLHALMNGSDTLSRAAADRVRGSTAALSRELGEERLLTLVGYDPAAPLALEARDLASAEDASGLALGKLLPLLAVLMLISGGSFAALGAFAGERESGTLETLFVQPVPPASIARGKFAAVLVTSLAALFGNAASFLVCLALGIGKADFLPGFSLAATGGRLALGLLLFLPTALFLAALLALISARARSFREGQHYVLPLVLLSMGPAALPAVQRVELGWWLALVPIAGNALALRDALAGALALGPALLAFAAGSGWAWLALVGVSRTLDAERLLAAPPSRAERALHERSAHTAVGLGAAAVLLVYVVGGRLQAWRLVPGLALTLAVLLPLWTALATRRLRALAGASSAQVLGLGAPLARHVLGALLAAPALAELSRTVFAWQSRLLPVPSELTLIDLELSWPWVLLLLCLAPAVFEELLFRGALLFGMRHDWSVPRTLAWQALLFGAVHASVYRFVPTALAGCALAALALRARCVWPAMVLHLGHNAWLAFGAEQGFPAWLPAAGGLLGLALLAAPRR